MRNGNKKNQIVRINQLKCIGCGSCQSICPEGFEIIGGKSRVKNADAECIEQAARACPVGAITFKQEKKTPPEDLKEKTSF